MIELTNDLILTGNWGETCTFQAGNFGVTTSIEERGADNFSVFLWLVDANAETRVRLIEQIEIGPIHSERVTNGPAVRSYNQRKSIFTQKVNILTAAIAKIDEIIADPTTDPGRKNGLNAQKAAKQSQKAKFEQLLADLTANPVTEEKTELVNADEARAEYFGDDNELTTAGIEWIQEMIPELAGLI